MTKKNKTPFGIFIESAGLYFSNADKFIKYMTFPVLGQIAGLLLIFGLSYFFIENAPKLIEKYPNLNSLGGLVVLTIIITLPGLAIFCKAFWEYLIAYGAVNSMVESMTKNGKLYDFAAHTELIKKRAVSFIGLWFLFGIFSVVAVCPLFWVICAVFAVYFVLVFQVFTFEPELSPLGCVKKSLMLVKGHFSSTFMLMVFAGILSYILIPQIMLKIFDGIGLSVFLAKMFIPVVKKLPELNVPELGLIIKHSDAAIFMVQMTVAQIFVQYTLPMRSILWSLWYKELNKGYSQQADGVKKSAKSKKRPSEKLMEESYKKFSKTKIDSNILKRASEKDDDE